MSDRWGLTRLPPNAGLERIRSTVEPTVLPACEYPCIGSAHPVKSGKIVIEWVIGSDPNDFDTYGWGVKCEPPVSDELVAGILAEVLRVY
jgi:hypothetical protein